MTDVHGGWAHGQPDPLSQDRHRAGAWRHALAGAGLAAVAATAAAVVAVVAGPAAAFAAATPPGAPVGVKAVAGASEVRLTWQPPPRAASAPPEAGRDESRSASPAPSSLGYFVYEGTSPGGELKTPVNARPVSGLSYVVTGLANGTAYYFTVAAAGARVAGEATSAEVTATPATTTTVTPATRPGAPTGLAVALGHARTTLSWTAPASDGGSAVTSYRVYHGGMTDFTHGTLAGTVTGTRAAITGLTSGASYWFRVAAVNAVGQGTWSVPVLVSVPSAGPATAGPGTPGNSASASAPATAPPLAAPTGLTAAVGDAQVLVSWTAPASDGGTPVTRYRLYMATVPGSQAGAVVTSMTGTSAMVTGLTDGVTYYFTVAAVNAAGRQGPLSAEVSARPGAATMMALTSRHVPNQLIAWLAALSVTALAGALAVAVMGKRMNVGTRRR
jgi:titin